MARFRLSRPAQTDIRNILATSAERWGIAARRRYAALLSAAMRKASADPYGPSTRDRAELLPGIRSLHIRLASNDAPEAGVRRPAHILFYRLAGPEFIEIVRVPHERSDPGRHLEKN